MTTTIRGARGFRAALLGSVLLALAPVGPAFAADPAAASHPAERAVKVTTIAAGQGEHPAERAVKVTTIAAGQGEHPAGSDFVLINYQGKLADGTVFDQARNSPLPLDQMIPGFAQGLLQMQRGGRYSLFIPWELGYGEEGSGPIPPKSDLTFEIELIDFKTPAEVEAMIAQMRAEQAQAQGGAPAQAPAPAAPSGN